jgi:CelD/BcsL family acetyltransferase involved in cellulose biosynthesis
MPRTLSLARRLPAGTRIVPLSALGPADLACWRELAAHALQPNPFFEPELMLGAAQLVDGRAPELIVVGDGGRWHACLPVQRRRRWHSVRLPCLVGLRHAYAYLGSPLVRPETLAPALDALLAAAASVRSALLVLEWIGADGPLLPALHGALRRRGAEPIRYERFERAALRRGAADQPPARGAKQLRELGRKRRAIERELGALRFGDRSADPAAPADFLALEASGWKGRQGSAMLCDPAHAAWFRAGCDALAAQDRLELLELRAGETILAMICNFVSGDTAFGFKTAYAERFRAGSPGILLEAHAIERFYARDRLRWMDSCTAPDSEVVRRWPQRRRLETLLVPGGGPLARAFPTLRAVLARRRGPSAHAEAVDPTR